MWALTVKRRRKNTGTTSIALEVKEAKAEKQPPMDKPVIEVPIVKFKEIVLEQPPLHQLVGG